MLNILKLYLEDHITLMHFIGQHEIYMDITEEQNLTQKCEAGLPPLEWKPQRESRQPTGTSTGRETALLRDSQFVQMTNS